MTMQAVHVPPRRLEAEASVLGSAVLGNEPWFDVVATEQAENFFKEAKRTIFRAMAELFAVGEPVDLMTITEKLHVGEHLDLAGGARAVREKAVLGSIIGVSGRMMRDGYARRPAKEVLDAAEVDLRTVALVASLNTVTESMGILTAALRNIEDFMWNEGKVRGLPTGSSEVDRFLHGLHAGRQYVFVGWIGSQTRARHGLGEDNAVGPKGSPS